ncbi:MAG: co-chaperone GroES [Chloroflexi bacterium]|nr:co-chaperone GroES [Chloroflexota bacterium]
MSVNFKPLGNHLVVEPIESESRTASGIILPETAQEKPQTGVVVAVGSGLRLMNGTVQAMTVQIGDKVLYSKYAGTTIKVEKKDLLILSEDDILAIVE